MVDTASLQKLLVLDRGGPQTLAEIAAIIDRPIQAKPVDFVWCVPGRNPCRMPGDPLVLIVQNASRGNGTARVVVTYAFNMHLDDGDRWLRHTNLALDFRIHRGGWVLTRTERVSADQF
jgi:hypothetical protein